MTAGPEAYPNRRIPMNQKRRRNSAKRSSRPPVRFGGVRTPDGYVFELTGGHPCLDLANTVDDRRTSSPKELLASPEDLVDWGRQTGVITTRDSARLVERALRHHAEAERALARVRVVREIIFAVFSAIARGTRPTAASLSALGREVARALSARELVYRDGGLAWIWPADNSLGLERIVWPVLASAADLLSSDNLPRVRECAGEGCGWLFLDRSKNGTRRWCDMTVCGNRAKMQRYRSRRA